MENSFDVIIIRGGQSGLLSEANQVTYGLEESKQPEINSFGSKTSSSYYMPKYLFQTFNIRALMATTTVLTLINTAPIAGLSIIPKLYRTPAASGSAITL